MRPPPGRPPAPEAPQLENPEFPPVDVEIEEDFGDIDAIILPPPPPPWVVPPNVKVDTYVGLACIFKVEYDCVCDSENAVVAYLSDAFTKKCPKDLMALGVGDIPSLGRNTQLGVEVLIPNFGESILECEKEAREAAQIDINCPDGCKIKIKKQMMDAEIYENPNAVFNETI